MCIAVISKMYNFVYVKHYVCNLKTEKCVCDKRKKCDDDKNKHINNAKGGKTA